MRSSSDIFTSLNDPPRTQLATIKRTIDSTDCVQCEQGWKVPFTQRTEESPVRMVSE